MGITTELIGLALCLSFGFLFGIVYISVGHWNEGFWLKDEMVARYIFNGRIFSLTSFIVITILRGQLRSLWIGVLIALPSGAGVALSVLGIYLSNVATCLINKKIKSDAVFNMTGGNVGSLVGVAISASLLPPVVNTV